MIQQQQQLNGFWPLCNSILFAFWVRHDLGKSLTNLTSQKLFSVKTSDTFEVTLGVKYFHFWVQIIFWLNLHTAMNDGDTINWWEIFAIFIDVLIIFNPRVLFHLYGMKGLDPCVVIYDPYFYLLFHLNI